MYVISGCKLVYCLLQKIYVQPLKKIVYPTTRPRFLAKALGGKAKALDCKAKAKAAGFKARAKTKNVGLKAKPAKAKA